MRIVSHYKHRVNAEEDYVFLLKNGIVSIIYGDSAPTVLKEHFGSDPIGLGVQDEQFEAAKALLTDRHHIETFTKVKRWAIKKLKGKH